MNVLRAIGVVLLAAVTTSVALRLLGRRRGWLAALVAAIVGWSLAATVAAWGNDWSWEADRFALYVIGLGVPATMAVAVVIDLLARPGSLALGERAGLVVTPRPVQAIRRRISVLLRYRELVRLCRQEGFGPFLSASDRAERTVEGLGVRLRRVLEQAGGVYVKLGQIAATRVDLLPSEVCDELALLQNRVPPDPSDRILDVLQAELGRSPEAVFAEFDWEPMAAASIGQTYGARLHSGESVVVKVQRPDIQALVERDLAALALLAELAQRRTLFGQGMRTGELLAQFAAGLRAELDFRHEADAMGEMATLISGSSGVRVPKVYREYSGRRVLVQERFEGPTLADAAGAGMAAIDRPALADRLLRATLDQIMRGGLFHADPHPGNLVALADGDLGLIDFGAVGRLDPIQQSAIIDVMLALTRRDVGLLRDGVERIVEFNERTSPDELERALARLMAEHVRPGGNVDPSAFEELMSTLSRFGMRLPRDIVLLSRAVVTVDGTLRGLVPDQSFITAALAMQTDGGQRPVVDHKELIREELLSLLPHVRRLPERIDRVVTLAGRGDLRVRSVVDEDAQRVLRTLVNRCVLVLAGISFLAPSAWLLAATDNGPRISNSTGLFDVIGYAGLMIGAILVLRVVAAVARDGTT